MDATLETNSALIRKIRTLAGDFAWHLDCLPSEARLKLNDLISEEREIHCSLMALFEQILKIFKKGLSFWRETNTYFEQLTETEQKDWQELVSYVNAQNTIRLREIRIYSESLREIMNYKSASSNLL